jgi:hypothetical protein
VIYSPCKNEYRILKLAKATIRKGLKLNEKKRIEKKNRDETIGIIVHIYVEMSQGNYLCNYLLSQTRKNVSFFSFFLYKIREQEGRTGPVQGMGEELVPVGGGRWQGKGVKGE